MAKVPGETMDTSDQTQCHNYRARNGKREDIGRRKDGLGTGRPRRVSQQVLTGDNDDGSWTCPRIFGCLDLLGCCLRGG